MPPALLQVLEALSLWPGARWLQASGTAYLWVNAAHILGLGLLVGAIVPLDLRLLGLWRQVPLAALRPVLQPMAALGLALALLTGLWLFSVRPVDYAFNTAFQCKLALLVLALGNIAWQHGAVGWSARAQHAAAPSVAVRCRAALSLLLWLAMVLAGRWIGFL
ncbi:DUF2214 domain-containing protein [Comamonas terrigena]|jgi:hypothetical protein|uniref:DUF2214 domain-containing protein n=1 Tax=Comamonas terrigena TaxID=32013 RepID=UPI00244B8090|nr:DUF2214 domain-containing protein [Comamonas terrigena]MDH1293434.1 DUF2214 domain-containing protein [Comamonas terrigena]